MKQSATYPFPSPALEGGGGREWVERKSELLKKLFRGTVRFIPGIGYPVRSQQLYHPHHTHTGSTARPKVNIIILPGRPKRPHTLTQSAITAMRMPEGFYAPFFGCVCCAVVVSVSVREKYSPVILRQLPAGPATVSKYFNSLSTLGSASIGFAGRHFSKQRSFYHSETHTQTH